MKLGEITLLAGMIMILSACQSAGLFSLNVPTYLAADYEVSKSHIYGDQPWQQLDIYQPANAEAPLKTLVLIYGGGWRSGTKEQYAFLADAFTRLGYRVVIPDYTKYPEGVYPDYVEDAALATKWLSEHLAEDGGETDGFYLMGHSAGAHTAAMLVTNDRFLQQVGLSPNIYDGFIGLSGPYNFTPKKARYKRVFGGGPDFSHMKLNNFVNGNEPPMLLIHGAQDGTVVAENMHSFAEKLRTHDVSVTAELYEDLGHYDMIALFSRALPKGEQVIQDIDAFMQRSSSP